MSYFSFSQKELSRLLASCNIVSPKKSEIELFTYTKFEFKDKVLELTAINSSIFYKTTIKPNTNETEDGEELVFLIKTDIITAATSLINDEFVGIEIDLNAQTLSIQGAKSKHNLRINRSLVDDFKLPDVTEEKFETEIRLTLDDVASANKIATTAVGNPKVIFEPQFLNICYTLAPKTKEMYIVATDKYRLSKQKLVANYEEHATDVEFPKNYLLHPHNLNLLTACAGGEDEVVTLKFGQHYLWILLKDASLTMRYGTGNFPEYDKIIPQSFSCSFYVSTADLLESLRQIYFAARTNTINKTVTLQVFPAKKEIVFGAKTDDGNSSQSTISMDDYDGVSEEWSQSFNADYLIDYISSIKTEKLLWEANPGKPSVISPQNHKDTQMCLISGLR
jgi:DNA polymerase III subunit beta